MANNRKALTDHGIKTMKPHKTKRIELGDVVVPGLKLRCTPAGVKSFSLLYKVKGEGGESPKTGKPLTAQAHRITLGTFPMMKIKAARDMARHDM